MAADDLSAPLGAKKIAKRRVAVPIVVPWLIVAVMGLFAAVFAGWTMIGNDLFGGEPMAVVRIDAPPESAGRKSEEASPAPGTKGKAAGPNPADKTRPQEAEAANSPTTKTVTIIDGSSGKRQQVVIPNASDGKSEETLSRLAETSRHGLIPKIADDGTRPADAFARPAAAAAGKPGAPRVAIVVSGLGIGTTSTKDALAKLPAAVTFAFTAYGADLDSAVARARGGGHEVLLQLPMEPFDYPDNDPGPQTLLTALDAGQNIDRMHWLMSRFQGYVGVANAMGARFTASEKALAPVLREVAKRGLIYVDDGSSTRSLAGAIAGTNNVAFAKADVVIDAATSAADVDRALARLESLARERGTAVGTAGALPVSIERITRWAKAAEARGVVLVPISAAAGRPKSS